MYVNVWYIHEMICVDYSLSSPPLQTVLNPSLPKVDLAACLPSLMRGVTAAEYGRTGQEHRPDLFEASPRRSARSLYLITVPRGYQWERRPTSSKR